eukprot:6210108-Pleurochrysis_carterae.AAC.1
MIVFEQSKSFGEGRPTSDLMLERALWNTTFAAELGFIFLTDGTAPTVATTGQLSTTLPMSRVSSLALGAAEMTLILPEVSRRAKELMVVCR